MPPSRKKTGKRKAIGRKAKSGTGGSKSKPAARVLSNTKVCSSLAKPVSEHPTSSSRSGGDTCSSDEGEEEREQEQVDGDAGEGSSAGARAASEIDAGEIDAASKRLLSVMYDWELESAIECDVTATESEIRAKIAVMRSRLKASPAQNSVCRCDGTSMFCLGWHCYAFEIGACDRPDNWSGYTAIAAVVVAMTASTCMRQVIAKIAGERECALAMSVTAGMG